MIFVDFGVPGRFLGKALGRILAGKNWGEKNDEKKEVKPIASVGDADPGQDLPAGFLKHGSARLRSPGCRWAGGFNVLRTNRRARELLHTPQLRRKLLRHVNRIWFDMLASTFERLYNFPQRCFENYGTFTIRWVWGSSSNSNSNGNSGYVEGRTTCSR